jgi:hypothetical protein
LYASFNNSIHHITAVIGSNILHIATHNVIDHIHKAAVRDAAIGRSILYAHSAVHAKTIVHISIENIVDNVLFSLDRSTIPDTTLEVNFTNVVSIGKKALHIVEDNCHIASFRFDTAPAYVLDCDAIAHCIHCRFHNHNIYHFIASSVFDTVVVTHLNVKDT